MRSNTFSRSSLPLATQFNATPPARHRFLCPLDAAMPLLAFDGAVGSPRRPYLPFRTIQLLHDNLSAMLPTTNAATELAA